MYVPPPPAEPGRSPEGDAEPFPDSWFAFLQSNVAHYPLLSETEQKRLRDDIWTFITTKNWEGCRGFSVTEEVQVTIAAQACLMLLGREHACFDHVRTILVYPAEFQLVDEPWQDEGSPPFVAAGQAVWRGPVILAWDVVLAEGRDPSLGGNAVIHEFAHQLDYTDSHGDASFEYLVDQWHEVLTAEYRRLRRKVRLGRRTFLGEYAAENQAEFFAVASERFFTRPARLRRHHPALYDLLSAAYALDPVKWFAEAQP